jgi:hypothetical protein
MNSYIQPDRKDFSSGSVLDSWGGDRKTGSCTSGFAKSRPFKNSFAWNPVILGSLAAIAVCWAFGIRVLFGVGPWFVFETTALVAFGIAWMTKGQFILQEEKPKAMEVGTVQELVTK